MTVRLKSLGTAVLAALALSTALASSAHAAQFMSEGNVDTSVLANQSTTHTFSIEGNSSTCTTASFATAGLSKSPVSSIELHPVFSGCTSFGFINVKISTTGCNLVFTAPGTVVAGKVPGQLQLSCEPGKAITVAAGTCEVSIGPGSFTKGLTFENNTGVFPRTVTLHTAITGIAVTKVKDGFLCPLAGTGPAEGTYTGDTLAKGFNSEFTQTSITLE